MIPLLIAQQGVGGGALALALMGFGGRRAILVLNTKYLYVGGVRTRTLTGLLRGRLINTGRTRTLAGASRGRFINATRARKLKGALRTRKIL